MKKLNVKKCVTVLSTLVMTLGFVPNLHASSELDINGINVNSVNPSENNIIQPESITFGGQTVSDYVGAVTGTLGNEAAGYFFCFDLANIIYVPGSYQVNPTSPTTNFNTPALSYLGLSSPFNLQVASSLLNKENPSTFTMVNQFTGLQLAIWSILYNWTPTSQPTDTLNGAKFSTSATGYALSDALQYLQDAKNLVTMGTYTNTGDWQLLVVATDTPPGPNGTPPAHVIQTLVGIVTPEPATYLAMGSFLLIAGYCYKRKNQQKAV